MNDAAPNGPVVEVLEPALHQFVRGVRGRHHAERTALVQPRLDLFVLLGAERVEDHLNRWTFQDAQVHRAEKPQEVAAAAARLAPPITLPSRTSRATKRVLVPMRPSSCVTVPA